MDEIRIHELEVYGHHGVKKEENVLGQKFLISLTLKMCLRNAGISDDIADSIDYAQVSYLVKEEMERTNFNLIEALAEHLCEVILLTYPTVENVGIEVKKPWAPILLPLDTVSVRMERGWHDVFLSVGSNIGDRDKNINNAIESLKQDVKIRVVRTSSLIETKPYGVVDQPDFLNGCLRIRTLYGPEDLLVKIHEIEKEGGRERKEHWGPRTIDLDILYYDDIVMQKEELTIPHPEIALRTFVLEPLCEIAPWHRHSVTKKTTSEMLEEIKQ